LSKARYTDYDAATTERCERALVTLLGDLGPWRERIYLVGGLAPRYIVGQLPAEAPAHVGTTDVDLVIGLALGDGSPETYRTLQTNLEKSDFKKLDSSFRWGRGVEGVSVVVEFLCETDEVADGRIFMPKGEHTGNKLGALNIRGAQLVGRDFIECEISGDRLDGGGFSRVTVQVASLLSYVVLKTFAFQERHENKDAYDLIFTLLNKDDNPRAAGLLAAGSPIVSDQLVVEALSLLEERFADVRQDGPNAYGLFLSPVEQRDNEARARFRQESVAAVREFLASMREP
jgi:hypothetical protein